MNYLAAKIETLSAKGPVAAGPIVPALPATANPPEAPSPAPALKLDPGSAGVSPSPVAAPVQPAPSADLENQLGSLQNQVRQLQNDKSLLEAKLKEALAAQPAALDPRQLAKAEEQIKALQKENDLLKATEVSNRKLADQSALASKLALENQALQARLNSSTTDAEAAAALRAENQLLKKQLADLKVAPHSPKADQGRELAQAQARLAALQSDKEILRLEKIALEDRVKQLTAPSPVAASPVPPAANSTADASRIQQLERERDDLQKKLAAATKDASGRKGKAAAARVVEMENQVAALRARLETYEAHAVPYGRAPG